MKQPLVIAINAVSGGGKTTISKLLAATLPNAALFCFDDFESSNVYPTDYVEWFQRGADPEEFDCSGMAAAVMRQIDLKTADFLVLDYPFSRDHSRLRDQIHLSVFIDTPLDLALARRISRDLCTPSPHPAEDRLHNLARELQHYAEKSRPLYLRAQQHRDTDDLILDGTRPPEVLLSEILKKIHSSSPAV